MIPAKLAMTLAVLLVLAYPFGCSKKQGPGDGGEEKPGGATRPAALANLPEALSLPRAATDAIDAAHAQAAGKMINGGLMYLLKRREDDGAWSMAGGLQKPAVTAMVLKAAVQHPDLDADSPLVRRGFDVLLGYRQSDGGIYNPRAPEVGYANYSTSLSVMALAAAGRPRYIGALRDAVAYLRGSQVVPGSESADGATVKADDPQVGGSSYGKKGRPDGSNTGMWAEALHEAGVAADDPAMRRMMQFFSRLQQRTESNAAAWAREGPNDGGFVYAWGESKAGPGPGGRGLRSYGSLTYTGFKSLLYAGLTKADPRVRAAFDWIRTHWTLEANPNMPGAQSHQGLYYYYHAYAKALRAWGEAVIADRSGAKHNWRQELIDALGRRVRGDGSWANDKAQRWNEGSPVLATAYAVLALEEALKK